MTRTEYEEKFHKNQKITGRFLETTMHMPCPFCAEPEFMVYKILDTEKVIANGAVCKFCNRGCKAIVTRDAGGVGFRFVQTCGDDPPDYLPKMERES